MNWHLLGSCLLVAGAVCAWGGIGALIGMALEYRVSGNVLAAAMFSWFVFGFALAAGALS